jgi:hypothetical protein
MLVVFVGLMIICFSCSKYKSVNNDLGNSDNGYIRGQLVLYDTLTGVPYEVPQNNKMVTLRYNDSAASLNFLYSVQTDSNGYFVFNDDLPANMTYYLNYTDTGSYSLIYTAEASSVTLGTSTLLMIATPSFTLNTGIWYRFVDSVTGVGAIPGVNACIFTSLSLYSDTSCMGSTYPLTSDQEGRAFVFNLQPGTYYSRISVNYPSLSASKMDVFAVSDTLVRKYVILP